LRPPKILSRKNHPGRGGVPAQVLGSTAAPAVVRRALAVNSSREPKAFTMVWSACIAVADDEGVVGCARGGRAPQPRPGRNLWSIASQNIFQLRPAFILFRRGRQERHKKFNAKTQNRQGAKRLISFSSVPLRLCALALIPSAPMPLLTELEISTKRKTTNMPRLWRLGNRHRPERRASHHLRPLRRGGEAGQKIKSQS